MKISFKVKALNKCRAVFMIPLLESWLAARTEGLPPDHPISKLVPNPYQYPPDTVRRMERNGIAMGVDISDYIGHYLFFGFSDSSTQKLFSLCGKDFSVLDIGANIGWTALNLARISTNGTVIGFEPDPYNFDRCSANVKMNAINNVTIYPVGLGDKNGQIGLEVRTAFNRGGNRIAPDGAVGVQSVELVRLDDFDPVTKLTKIDLVKIDVEGYELQVLRGGHQVLKRHKPLLFIEVDDRNLRDQGDSARELISYIFELGYAEIIKADDGSRISLATNFDNCHFDMIAK